ncbi:MAG: c-type cytochrome domain-containing protein, partial [Bradymonadaceae bacterium]
TSVDDRCEQPGDRFKIDGQSFNEIEIGFIDYVPGEYVDYRSEDIVPDAESPGLHVHLRNPVPIDSAEVRGGGQFIRTFISDSGNVEDLTYASFSTRWWILDGGRHLVGEVRNNQSDRVNDLLAVGIVQGDVNRNGTYGASESRPLPLLKPGDPDQSYLIGRMRGVMAGIPVAGSRMPLANQPLSIPEMVALFCFVEGLPADGAHPNMTDPINYGDCSYSDDPESLNLLGEGVTWKGRVSRIFEANCSGCHGGNAPSEGLDLRDEDAYQHLFEFSVQNPELRLIEPGDPERSYLWLKLINEDSIEGFPMPFNPLTGEGKLREGELGDIQTWIVNGAIEDE